MDAGRIETVKQSKSKPHERRPIERQGTWFDNLGPGVQALNTPDLNPDLYFGGGGPAPQLEPDSGHGAVAAVRVQKGDRRRFFVRVTSFRRNLLDEDNLCEKYHVDLCRYAGALPGDGPTTTTIKVCQEKVGSTDPEYVRIEVFEVSEKKEEAS